MRGNLVLEEAPQSISSFRPHVWDHENACIFLDFNTEMCKDSASSLPTSRGRSWAVGSYRISGSNNLKFVEHYLSMMSAFLKSLRIPWGAAWVIPICFGNLISFTHCSELNCWNPEAGTAEHRTFSKDFWLKLTHPPPQSNKKCAEKAAIY